MIIVGIAIALGFLLGAAALVKTQSSSAAKAHSKADFDTAMVQEKENFAGRALVGAGRAFSGLPYTNLNEESPGYKSLRYKIAASGGLFGGSVNVFLSTQVAAGLLSAVAVSVALFSGLSGLLLIGVVAFAIAFTLYPYQRLTGAAKKRTAQVNQDLPDFAELLLMPLSGGFGVVHALGFAAERAPDNLVAQEASKMMQAMSTRSISDEEAFAEAGARLGTPGAIAFFNTLAQAYLEGAQAVTAIRGQATQLRKIAYQDTREKLKKLPVKLVVIIGIHLMPTLLLVILVPIGLQLTQSLSQT